jgi:hypothetical protein
VSAPGLFDFNSALPPFANEGVVMKAFSTIAPVFFAVLVAVACGDDDDDSTPTVVQCKTPYEDQTNTSLKAATSASGKCANDTETICANNMIKVAGDCGVGCFQMSQDPAEQLTCARECIKMNTSPPVSDPCATCYVSNVACSIQFCLTQCLTDPAGAACAACRVENHCTDTFYTCSGLPVPASQAAGGAGGNAGAANTSGGELNTSGGTGGGSGPIDHAGQANTSGGTAGGGGGGGA